ncbi:hypothetical protein GCM10027091_47360 [Streptomyces daliensis]
MIVPVTVVTGVAVAVVHVVDVVTVRHGDMSAALAVPVPVVVVGRVPGGLALVHVVAVDTVEVAVVGVVHVVLVRHGDVSAALAVLVDVVRVGGVCSAHGSLVSGGPSATGCDRVAVPLNPYCSRASPRHTVAPPRPPHTPDRAPVEHPG